MKFATRKSDKWQVTGGMKKTAAQVGISCHASRVTCHVSAFTLAEVLAAMLFLAIVIPTAVEALHVSSLAGEVAARKGAAARIADRILNESLVMTNWNNGVQNGTVSEGALDFRWTLSSQAWPQDAMQLLTAQVTFQAQGKDYSVKLSTLASSQNQPTTTMSLR
jgi:Tfp pilus assembly protein PilV